MARKQRDYKAEYQRRVLKARQEGYSGYGQKRSKDKKAKQEGYLNDRQKRYQEQLVDRLLKSFEGRGFYDMEEMPEYDSPEYWAWFREMYTKAHAA